MEFDQTQVSQPLSEDSPPVVEAKGRDRLSRMSLLVVKGVSANNTAMKKRKSELTSISRFSEVALTVIEPLADEKRDESPKDAPLILIESPKDAP